MSAGKTDNPVGRPKKEKLPRGRPKGQESIMKEYRMRMLRSPKSRKVLQAVFDVATDPEHKHFPACSKMVLDRIAPISDFTEKDLAGNNKIEINISGVPGVQISGSSDVLEGEVVPKDES